MSSSGLRFPLALSFALLLTWLAVVPAIAQPTTTRVSVGAGGAQGNADSQGGTVSADGRWVAFMSWASNLVADDSNGEQDVFVRDLLTGTTTRVSVGAGGVQANASSYDHAISADGRFVAFHSLASNLVPDDTNGQPDIFVHDRETGATTLISLSSDGAQARAPSYGPAISADGRWVAFHTDAALVADDTNQTADVYVRDRFAGVTTRVSVGTAGAQANAQNIGAALSADGRLVAFVSFASNLAAGDRNGEADVFVHDRETGITTGASAWSGTLGGGTHPTISADGRWVAFSSGFSWFDDTNNAPDVFVHDRQTGTTTRVSVGTGGVQANGSSSSSFGAISSDGRWVAFHSMATNLVSEDTNGQPDVFVHDRQTGITSRASVGPGGIQGNATSVGGAISAGARRIVFQSNADNLVADDTNGEGDVFMYEAGAACGLALAPAAGIVPAAGASGRVMVIGAGDCAWTAVSSAADWLAVTAGASGMGFGVVEFSAAQNPGPSRSGTLTIGNQAVTISQAGVATPMAPTGLLVHSVVGTRVTLRWRVPTTGPRPTGFVLEGGQRPGEVLVSIPTGSASPAFALDVPAGSFYARVHALNGGERSAASNEVRVHVNVAVGPSPPANLLAVVDGSSVALTWTNTYGGGAPLAVVLELFGPPRARVLLGLVDHVRFDGVPAGTHRVAVSALNAAGQSEWSNIVELTVPGACTGPPAVPTNLLAVAQGPMVSAAWTPGTAGPAPTGYVLIAAGPSVYAVATGERWLQGSLGPGTYAVRVIAVNPCGLSAPTPPQTVVVP